MTDIYKTVVDYFMALMPNAKTELNYNTPFQLLVAVMLSAQCTDKRVNIVTKALFERFPTAQDMSIASFEDVYSYIKSVSYPNSKANHLLAASKMIVELYGGEIPKNIDDLQTLPGVGRKTANVVASVLFGAQVMPVDTHVFRVSARIGLTLDAKNPLQAEKQLEEGFDNQYIGLAHHWLILHGRNVCKARKPKCEDCGLKKNCKYFNENRL